MSLDAAKLKVSWEPFIEPWQFLLTLVRDQEMSVLPNRSLSTDIVLKSTSQLNINITESLVEVFSFLFCSPKKSCYFSLLSCFLEAII